MDDNLVETIMSLTNMSEDEVTQILAELDGDEYQNLVYLIQTGGGSHVKQIMDHLKKRLDKKDPNVKESIFENFTYSLRIENPKILDSMIEWLDNQKLKYKFDLHNKINVNCDLRSDIYKIWQKLTALGGGGKKIVIQDEISEAHGTKIDKRSSIQKAASRVGLEINMAAKDKKGGAHSAKTKKSIEQKRREKEDKDLKFTESFEVGQKVFFENKLAEITIPSNTDYIGITLNGETKMVDKKNIEKLDENVTGFTNMPSLMRLKELAGVDMAPEPMGDESFDAEMDGIPSMSDVPVVDDMPMDNMDAEMNDMPMDDVTDVADAPIGDAFSDINDALNNVSRLLPEVKINEFKGLVKRLEDLTNEARSVGRTSLSEQAKGQKYTKKA